MSPELRILHDSHVESIRRSARRGVISVANLREQDAITLVMVRSIYQDVIYTREIEADVIDVERGRVMVTADSLSKSFSSLVRASALKPESRFIIHGTVMDPSKDMTSDNYFRSDMTQGHYLYIGNKKLAGGILHQLRVNGQDIFALP